MSADSSEEDLAVAERLWALSTLPEPAREAREAAWGLAGFGLAYVVIMGVTLGGEAAGGAAIQFLFSWLLGLVVCAFAHGASAVRVLAIVFAVAQAVVGWQTHPHAVPFGHWIVAVLYSLGAATAVVYQLTRAEAKTWFDVDPR
ncbi:hypothetical protein DFR70_116148 [Nocardia tenerifensis]|uniref:Uncharacterized protein n=1 Tax=Nocardia tenerifensis TaxID=228006 RepID=A0A318JQN0_9NOCA|nr:hypothetical protein [Nocardia tenerifensis]PXX57918.1 hypothetical protein DFR70_116148 [Nocardia tenerifensis]